MVFSALLRRPIHLTTSRRLASTSSSGGSQKAASEAANKASETAARATKAAQDAASKASALASRYAGGVGEKVSNYFHAYRGPVVYNTQVFLQVLKQVYKAEKLAPPTSLAEIQSAYRTLFNRAKDTKYWQDLYVTGQWKKVAIGGLEVYGIFKIGEIIGRRSLVGYKLD